MAPRIVKVEPFDLVVFGGTGDLAHRKLYPALFHRERSHQFSEPTRIVAASRRHLDREAFRASVKDTLIKLGLVDGGASAALERFLSRLDFIAVDARGDGGWADLKAALGADDRIRAYYLATAPDLFCPLAKRLGAEGIVTPRSRIIVEKPIGKDSESAAAINDVIGSVFLERNIFRIDHYLGKESVQNLMALRFANILLEPVWNSAHIDHVQITVAETLGVEGRGDYYETAGAIRDMVQNHMMQLLCLVAMEPPNSLEADALRDEKLKVLKALQPIDETNASTLTVRGQYRGGFADGGPVSGYLQGPQRDGNLRRPQTRDRQLAMGRGSLLSPHREKAAATLLRNRGWIPSSAACHIRGASRRHTPQSPGDARPAGRGDQAL